MSKHRGVAAALLGSLAVLWLNFALTTRWAHVDGSINGPKRPFFFAALVIATLSAVAAYWKRDGTEMSPRAARAIALAGVAVLAVCFLRWFPISTWRQIPFLDDWPIRYQSAVDMMRLVSTGAFTGWEWRFNGGYHSSSDATQGLGTLTFLPMRLFGPALGFHLAHVLLFAALPVLVWRDLSLDPSRDDRVSLTAAGLTALFSTGYGYFLIRSGDTNSLGGVVMLMVTLLGAHAARRGRRWGAWTLVCGLAATAYAHPGFFIYASLYLLLDAAIARDRAAAARAIVASAAGVIASLPLTWESWRYPQYFFVNTLFYEPPRAIDWPSVARTIYYNVELLWLPGRWFNDYAGLAIVFAPVTIALAIVDRSRVRFYAFGILATLALMRLSNVYAGYVFLRPIHMLAVFAAPVLAALLVRHAASGWLRWSLVAVLALYVQIWFRTVPTVRDVRDFNAALVDRITQAPGALVLLENNPHRNMNAEPGGTTEPSRFGTHYEPLVAETTRRRLYAAGYADGWSWSPWRGQVVGGGTFMGRSLANTPHDAFVSEMRRWGVVDLFVWSRAAAAYLREDARFREAWSDADWTQFRLQTPDPREVVTATGAGTLANAGSHHADVALTGVRAGDPVIVRTNFHPAWSAAIDGRALQLDARDGQLSFVAPCTGDCTVALAYPAHRAFIPLAIVVLLAAGFIARRTS
jgi:hypothetical protein